MATTRKHVCPYRPHPRVLHVDDDATLRGLVELTLSDAGFAVDSVADGIAALDRLSDRGARFDAVVLDLVMPRLNGLEVLAALRAAPHTRALPVLVTSGTLISPRDFSNDAQTYVLPKPFTEVQLVGALTAMACEQESSRSREPLEADRWSGFWTRMTRSTGRQRHRIPRHAETVEMRLAGVPQQTCFLR